MINHPPGLLATALISSKITEVIIQKIFQIWVTVYGAPEKVLIDNGSEFANECFIIICKSMNINFKVTCA